MNNSHKKVLKRFYNEHLKFCSGEVKNNREFYNELGTIKMGIGWLDINNKEEIKKIITTMQKSILKELRKEGN